MIRKIENAEEKILNKVEEIILKEKLILNNEKIIVAVSGGPDSMCLIDVLNTLKNIFLEKYNINYSLVIAHVNHMLRAESKQEKIYVEEFANNKAIPFYYLEANVKELSKEQKISEEMCGRKVRYDFFEKIRVEEKAHKIAIAHNLNDDVETILLNIIRGCGLKGLTGINYKNNFLIRPLLDIQKEDIIEYNKNRELNPCFDKTNEEDIYVRNKVRLKLIPNLKEEYNENITLNIIRMKNILKQDEEFLEEYTQKVINDSIIENNSKYIKINFSNILKEDDCIKTRVIRKLIYLRIHNLEGIVNIHILDILELLKKHITGKKYIIKNKFTIEVINKNIIVIY